VAAILIKGERGNTQFHSTLFCGEGGESKGSTQEREEEKGRRENEKIEEMGGWDLFKLF
jgi:hypothetical protein